MCVGHCWEVKLHVGIANNNRTNVENSSDIVYDQDVKPYAEPKPERPLTKLQRYAELTKIQVKQKRNV